jgi:hypothetical protein
MSDQTKSRFAVDLDDLERQLRQTATGQPRAANADPLAELARIVGRDDPYKAMFAQAPVATARAEPRVATEPLAAPAPRPKAELSLDDLLRDMDAAPARAAAAVKPAVAAAQAPVGAAAPSRDMIDEFDKLLRDELRGSVQPTSSAALASAPAPSVAPVPVPPPRPALRAVETQDRPPAARDLDDIAREEAGRLGPAQDRMAHDRMADEPPPADYPEPPAEPPKDLRSLEARQPRKGMVMAAALLGVAVLGIGAVIGVRVTGGGAPSGEPPLVRAEPGPTRVQPQNPGGVEIPNQNKEILERREAAQPADSRVVNREEQPLDVQTAARTASRVILPPLNPPAPTATPNGGANGAAALAPTGQAEPPATGLGEPRRVRTVSVRPDGTIAGPNGPTTPTATGSAPPPTSTATARPTTPPAPPATPPRPVTRPAAEEPATARPVAQRPPERTQTAAAPATTPATIPPPRAAEPAQPAGSGFMVQLAAPGSEAEARATFASLQRRFNDQLSGEAPTIRRAEANGRTVYRVRIGPFSREDAVEKCEALRAAGGQCFIAR